ncbi:LysR family transcriptional regulator [Bordetella sp. 02P26C-1]|uniref:LysR family transcriptional regulator n=1 Tax=Bordetella sp. 02P26C-1 TaxID=2683195 RepID=UPI00135321EF|nr:LysR family transcriptional regulator [Bordetella sp. 02P26C-1]MVW78807.1 LysR family transcriptional regulator [Bordetella sp. 02P26C-1]
MDLRQLQRFVTLMETRNFHRAAALLHMAQPPLSVSIRRLEDTLGGKLFERHPSGLIPTPMAHAILRDARIALFHAEQCRLKAQETLHGLQGQLRMGFIGSATYKLLPQLIPALRHTFPKLELDLLEMTSLEILEGIRSQHVDMGFLRFPVGDVPEVEVIPLERDDFVLAVPSNSPLTEGGRTQLALSEVAQQPFILYPKSRVPGLAALAATRCQLSGFAPRVVQEAMQVHTILSLVASGVGVALVAGVAQHVQFPGVTYLTLTDTPAEFCVGMALAVPHSRRSAIVNNVLEYVQLHHQVPEMQQYALRTANSSSV